MPKGVTRGRMPYLLVTAVDSSEIKGIINVNYLFDDNMILYIIQIDRRDEKLQHSYHCTPPLADSQGGGKIVSMVYFMVNIIKLSS